MLNNRILFLLFCIVCVNTHLFAQISGTSCANAVNININGCSTSATFPFVFGVNGNSTMDAACASLTVKVGAWFKFTTNAGPPATVSTTITLAGSSQDATQRNLAIELYEDAGCPTAPTYVSCMNANSTTTETLVATLNASTTYYIRILNVASGTAQNISNTQVCVKQPPPNDIVDGAIPLTVGTNTCNYTTYAVSSHSIATNASGSGTDCWSSPPCGTYVAGSNDVWFSTVVPSTGNFFINTLWSAAAQDYAMAVYSSSVCGSASVLGCSTSNPEGLASLPNKSKMPTLYVQGATPGSTVYIRVWKEASAINTFSICVNDMGPCGNLPNNDFCSNPLSINTGGAPTDTAYNPTGITYTTDNPGNLQGTAQYGNSPCVAPINNAWYSFVATAADAAGLTIPFTVAAPCSKVSATVLSVTTNAYGCCKEFAPIACSSGTNSGTFNISIPSSSLTAGATYYLMVNQANPPSPSCQYSITGWSIAGTLPVELVSFTANNKDKYNAIEWITSSDINVDSYTIEKSYDVITFEEVGTLKSTGNYKGSKYAINDWWGNTELIYYRVRVTAKDGKQKYSNIISVNIDRLYDLIANIHPNPTTADLNFEYYLKNAGSINVQLIDYSGKLAFKNRYTLSEGKNNLTLPMSELENGVYILKVVSEKTGKTTYNKVVKN